MFKIGMIHGRYQPFHLGHFMYLKEALLCSQKLIVGITNPDPSLTNIEESDSHRHQPDANPFPYFLRMKMIQKSILLDSEIIRRIDNITIVPFPINKPEMWKYYIPSKDVVQIINIIDPWDQVKKEMFERNGFKVHILGFQRYKYTDEGIVSGTIIRDEIKTNLLWQNKVPPGTKFILESWLAGNIETIF